MRHALIATAASAAASLSAFAGVQYVNALGSGSGWYSDDTRNAAGQVLNGTNSSWQPAFGGFVPPSTANDAAIAQQIYFTDTGTATTGGTGVMVLDGTTSNSGKSSVKFYGAAGNPGGLGSGASLASFTCDFRWFMDNYTTSRTPALSLLIQGSNGLVYSMAYVGAGAQTQSWNTFSVNANTAASTVGGVPYGWFLFSNGAPGGTVSKSLNEWLSDATFGSILSGGTVLAQGFNIGSSQRNCRVGIDWMQSSLLNGGDLIDFGTVVPAPGALALLGVAAIPGTRRRRA
jgi:MYXO-CTERM domain-containing protein